MRLFPTFKTKSIYLLVALSLLSFSSMGFAQVVKTLTIENPDDALMINEFGGLILNANDTIKVEMVLPPENRDEAYRELDIQAGDIIKMVNGKKLTSLKIFKDIYENAKLGEEIKLGIYRDKKMTLAKFVKADFSAMQGGMQITMGSEGGMPVAGSFIDAGLLLGESDGKIIISDVVEEIAPKFKNYTPQNGDVIVSIQGNDVGSPDELENAYKQIKVGDTVTLVLLHENDKVEMSFSKPEEKAVRKVIKTVK